MQSRHAKRVVGHDHECVSASMKPAAGVPAAASSCEKRALQNALPDASSLLAPGLKGCLFLIHCVKYPLRKLC